ncbi:hypothetical protein [Cloacibacterium rupense]|nr:hypothetical protein [Cloacibacterium rupense]
MTIKTLLVKQKPAYFCIRRNMVGFFLMLIVSFFRGNTLDKKYEPSEGSKVYTADTLQVNQAKGVIYLTGGATIIDTEGALHHYELVVKKATQNKKKPSPSKRIALAKKKVQRPVQVKNISTYEHYETVPASKEVMYGFHEHVVVCSTQQNHYQRSMAVLGSYCEYLIFYADSDDLIREVRLDFLSISEDFFSVRPPPVSTTNSLFI